MIVALSENGARDALGGLDVVVANAGVPTRFQPVHEVEVGYWKRILGIDLDGVFQRCDRRAHVGWLDRRERLPRRRPRRNLAMGRSRSRRSRRTPAAGGSS
jgi:NAD(P)-dependent dehydrogenase (short-subunit alcohol dehydrogenase family)